MSDTTETPDTELTAATEWCEAILARVSEDLEMMLDRDLPITETEVSRAHSRPCAEGGVHIAFRLGFLDAEGSRTAQGALLVPLPEALAMANLMMMAPDAQVEASRALDAPDEPTRDSLMEISKMIGASVDAELKGRNSGRWTAGTLGCQGVAAGVRPAFEYVEGDSLVVARARARVGGFDEFPLLLVLPELDG